MPTSGIRIVSEKNLSSLSLAKGEDTSSSSSDFTELDIIGAPVTLDNVMIMENIQPVRSSSSSNKTFFNLDSKAWGGGHCAIVTPTAADTPVFAELQTNNMIARGGRGGGGGRRRGGIKEEQLSPEEEERLRLRRERNKEAAARCRKRRVDQTDSLQAQVDEHEEKKRQLQEEISSLQSQKEDLQFLLDAHRQVCGLNLQPTTTAATTILNVPAAPVDMRMSPLMASTSDHHHHHQMMTAAAAPKVIVKSEMSPYHQPAASEERHLTHEEALEMPARAKRPASLSLSVVGKPQCLRSIEGIPIETPTNVFSSLNFDSLMDGRTGLTPTNVLTPVSITMSLHTPVSYLGTTPSTPTCSSQQQRNNAIKSPSSKPNLVSL